MFAYDPAITARYPTIRAGIVHAQELTNDPSPPELLDAHRAGQRAAAERLQRTAVADLPSIAAWRRAFTRFGAKPTQHRNAAEALLRRLTKHGDIPSINTLVDIGNLVSIRYAVPVAVVDRSGITGDITVRFAEGHEHFTDLGATGSVHPEPGEVIFVDHGGVVCARRWCWRQSAQSATRATTVEALMVVEGHHDGAGDDVAAACTDLAALLATHQPAARTATHLLSPAVPAAGAATVPAAGAGSTTVPAAGSTTTVDAVAAKDAPAAGAARDAPTGNHPL